MSQEDHDQAAFHAAVRAEVAKQVAQFQTQFAASMEAAIRANLRGLDHANAELKTQQIALVEEIDAAHAATIKAEREGEKIAEAYFQNSRSALGESARQSLLRELTWMHLQAGRSVEDICLWLGVKRDFVEELIQLLDRKADTRRKERKKNRIQLDFNPRLRYVSSGRSGSIVFQNDLTQFELWWEFGGGGVLAIIDIPTEHEWTARTQLPLEHRDGVLQFIAEQVLEDQAASSAGYEIGDGVITIFD